ncbi:TonB family protein [bacterium]|nr:TonB family protein [bacterium]
MNDTSDLKYFLISLSLHLSLFLVFAIKIVLFPNARLEYIRAVRVDFVALPDKDPQLAPPGEEKPAATQAPVAETKPQAPAPVEEKPTSKPETPAETKPVEQKPAPKQKAPKETKVVKTEEKFKEQQSSALQRIAALSKIKKKKTTDNSIPEGTTVKGNRLNEGNSLTGVEKIEYNRYLSDLDLHIKKNWHLPEWLVSKPLTASIWVRFDENGQLLEKKLLRSSGNKEFDKEALEAVNLSVPFPKPPENLISYFQSQGIELRFPE